ncbi:type 1 fimbrial protein [Serratia fonticola]|uniref:fimbrial protein n=1 Tax=Serratia fonticola TaxID=47917 RepID=UPI001AE4ED86|nr:fimbrial protein [Serratia fonticola]MBP1038854.1 type 1 fimbrial protein [Serratia fonticola]
MRSAQRYLKAALAVVLAGGGAVSAPVQAVMLDFSAVLTDSTCRLSLDKSTLRLGGIEKSQLRPNQLVAPQPFTLSVQDCTGSAGGSVKPVVTIAGTGTTQDGKWLFRNAGSAANTGILVIQSATANVPDYSQPEVKNNSVLSLANPGQIPVNQTFTFYAGASCGGSTGCAAVATGDVTATLMFTFLYQ